MERIKSHAYEALVKLAFGILRYLILTKQCLSLK